MFTPRLGSKTAPTLIENDTTMTPYSGLESTADVPIKSLTLSYSGESDAPTFDTTGVPDTWTIGAQVNRSLTITSKASGPTDTSFVDTMAVTGESADMARISSFLLRGDSDQMGTKLLTEVMLKVGKTQAFVDSVIIMNAFAKAGEDSGLEANFGRPFWRFGEIMSGSPDGKYMVFSLTKRYTVFPGPPPGADIVVGTITEYIMMKQNPVTLDIEYTPFENMAYSVQQSGAGITEYLWLMCVSKNVILGYMWQHTVGNHQVFRIELDDDGNLVTRTVVHTYESSGLIGNVKSNNSAIFTERSRAGQDANVINVYHLKDGATTVTPTEVPVGAVTTTAYQSIGVATMPGTHSYAILTNTSGAKQFTVLFDGTGHTAEIKENATTFVHSDASVYVYKHLMFSSGTDVFYVNPSQQAVMKIDTTAATTVIDPVIYASIAAPDTYKFSFVSPLNAETTKFLISTTDGSGTFDLKTVFTPRIADVVDAKFVFDDDSSIIPPQMAGADISGSGTGGVSGQLGSVFVSPTMIGVYGGSSTPVNRNVQTVKAADAEDVDEDDEEVTTTAASDSDDGISGTTWGLIIGGVVLVLAIAMVYAYSRGAFDSFLRSRKSSEPVYGGDDDMYGSGDMFGAAENHQY